MNSLRKFQSKIKLAAASLLLIPFNVISQDAVKSDPTQRDAFTRIFDYDTTTWLLIFLFLIMALAIYILATALHAVLKHYTHSEQSQSEAQVTKKKPAKSKESFWTMFDRNFLTRAVPVEREKDVMLDHDYDGIKELDNSLPPWWVWGFVVTIIFAVIYLLSYHVAGTGKLQLEEYYDEIALAKAAKAERIKLSGENITEENVVFLTDATALSEGKNIYVKNCVACHLADGGGQVGPNFTDEYWIHGGAAKNIFNTITEGVPAKGMISWKSQLTPKQIQQVASYIHTFQGTKPAIPKDPEGEKWVENVAAVTDSAKATTDSTVVKK
jgi:cytochrome c oxidase cbb3-type subunit 3